MREKRFPLQYTLFELISHQGRQPDWIFIYPTTWYTYQLVSTHHSI